jgi:hypothetical protein
MRKECEIKGGKRQNWDRLYVKRLPVEISTSITYVYRSQDSVVGIGTGRSSSLSRVKNFLFSTSSRLALGPSQTPIQWEPGVNRPGREAHHSHPTNAEVRKNADRYIHSPIRLHGVVLN